MSADDRQRQIADWIERRSHALDEVEEVEERLRQNLDVLKGLVTSLHDLYVGPDRVVLDLQLHAIAISDTDITHGKHTATTDAFECALADLRRLQWLREHIVCIEKNLKGKGINHP
ncbi:MAG: hypothetical protein OXG33_04135 [Chloroflexi bacterium]|nr:hypothetical protein [Chloroflexota bacterium]